MTRTEMYDIIRESNLSEKFSAEYHRHYTNASNEMLKSFIGKNYPFPTKGNDFDLDAEEVNNPWEAAGKAFIAVLKANGINL